MPICFMNTTFNATINLFIFILFLLHSVSYKKYYVENLKILWHYIVCDIMLNIVVCIAHYRGKFIFISNTKIQLKQSNRYYYYYYYYTIILFTA